MEICFIWNKLRPLSGQISYYRPLILCCDATNLLMVFLQYHSSRRVINSHMLDRDLTLELLSIFKVFEIIVDESARERP